MDRMSAFQAFLFPSDGRPPHVVDLMTSPASFTDPHSLHAMSSTSRIPHPEVYMDYIAEGLGSRAWACQVCLVFDAPAPLLTGYMDAQQFVEALDGMNKKFANPNIIFYPVIFRDGIP